MVGFEVGVGLGGDVGVEVAVGGVVAVGVEVVAVAPPPHAAKRSTAAIVKEKNTQDNRTRLTNDDGLLFMTITSSRFNGFSISNCNKCVKRFIVRYAKRLQYEPKQ